MRDFDVKNFWLQALPLLDGAKPDRYIRWPLSRKGPAPTQTAHVLRHQYSGGVSKKMKKTLCLFGALTLSFFLVGCEKIKARSEIKQANEAYEHEDYATALARYTTARQI